VTGGGLMVCGTGSDSGKSTIVAGLCRLLARRGRKVAPFKAQNMALNSAVTPSGHEIGRAQAAQAFAAGVDPEVAMNPILLKPTSDRCSQVVVMGRPWATLDAGAYHHAKRQLWDVVTGQLEDLRSRFDTVLCEGAGSPAEINLLDGDIVNLRVAHAAGFPAIVVGDIDRGGVFASLYGTVALLPDEWRPLVQGFVINKFRGDPSLLAGGPAELERRTGVPTIGLVPWFDAPMIDAEDSLGLRRLADRCPPGEDDGATLDVAAVRFPRISNFTDLEALALEPGIRLRLVADPGALGRPDLVILPGTKSTVADLAWLRAAGLDRAIRRLAGGRRTTIVGICGGYQMLCRSISDPAGVEDGAPAEAEGLALLPADTAFEAEKITRLQRGTALGCPVEGYEIHHGRTTGAGAWILIGDEKEQEEGASAEGGATVGTSLHGLFENDAFRGRFLDAVAARAGVSWIGSRVSFRSARDARLDRLADLLEAHMDIPAIEAMIDSTRRTPTG
jgi:adenosylcobyric acid synthase